MTLRRPGWTTRLAVAVCIGVTVGCTAEGSSDADLDLIQPGRLTVGTSLAFRPFAFMDDGEAAGFDITLMNEVAQRLDLEPEYRDAPLDALFRQLSTDELDAVISAIAITDERRASVLFTDPYFAVNQALVAAAGASVAAPEGLADRAVGVASGTTSLSYANANLPGTVRVVAFPSVEAAFVALESDQVAAVLADLPLAAEHVAASDGALEVAAELETDERYGIALPQGDEELAEAIDDALAAVVEDGTYAALYGEWFAGPVPPQFR